MSIVISRTIETSTPPARAFAYLADFTSTNDWDPGTVRTTRVAGNGNVGTEYANISRFAGREVSLRYVVMAYEPDRRFVVRARKKNMAAVDTMTFEPTATGGTRVTYHAEFRFTVPLRWIMPLFAPAYRRLGDEAEQGLKTALDRLAQTSGD